MSIVSKTSAQFFIVALIISSTIGLADDSIGLTIVSRGDVEVTSLGETRPLRQGDFIAENDEIVVGNRSFAVLQFVDGAKLSLRPDSTLIIEQYQFAGDQQDTATLHLIAGGMRVNLGAISSSRPKSYRIRTASGMLGMNAPEGSLSLCGNEVCEQQGLMELSN